MDLGAKVRCEVIAVQADVEPSQGDVHPLDRLDALGEPLRQEVAARDDAHQREVARALVGLGDLMGDAREGPVDLLRVHADRFDVSAVVHAHPFRRTGADGFRPGKDAPHPRRKKASATDKGYSSLAPFSPWMLGSIRLVGLSVPHLKD